MRPPANTYPVYFEKYISLVQENELMPAIKNNTQQFSSFLTKISEKESLFAYAEDKWTIRDLLQHVTDAERVFCFRAFTFAREKNPSLPSFDEKKYAEHAKASGKDWDLIKEEFFATRNASEKLFSSFSIAEFNNTGLANNNSISVLALGYLLPGHVYHHMNVITEKYLPFL